MELRDQTQPFLLVSANNFRPPFFFDHFVVAVSQPESFAFSLLLPSHIVAAGALRFPLLRILLARMNGPGCDQRLGA